MSKIKIVQRSADILHLISFATFLWMIFQFIVSVSGVIFTGVLTDEEVTLRFLSFSEQPDLEKALGFYIEEAAVRLMDVIMFGFICKYLAHEREVGTPFTEEGARDVFFLGIKEIIIPVVTSGITAIICYRFSVPNVEVAHLKTSAVMGISFIFVSFIFGYGAELQKKAEVKGEEKNG